ncbi:MAG: TrmH family RNA methyltransferase [Chloroflexota bacterium]
MAAPVITSLANPEVKRIRSLRSRKVRDQSGLCLAEGIRAVGEAGHMAGGIETLVIAPELLRSDFAWELIARVEAAGARRLDVSPAVFGSIARKEGPQGLAAVVRQRWEALADITMQPRDVWIGLEAIQDPGNLGTIQRTAGAVGAAGVILIGNTTDPYDATAIRASMGAVFGQRLARTGPEELKNWLHEHRCFTVGTSGDAALDYRTAGYRLPLVLLMGSEREGLPDELQSLCDAMVRIPMVGRVVDSLNLSVATGVMLYEVFSQVISPGTWDEEPFD